MTEFKPLDNQTFCLEFGGIDEKKRDSATFCGLGNGGIDEKKCDSAQGVIASCKKFGVFEVYHSVF